MHREHPLRILKYSTKTIWLLIFPFLRGLWNVFKAWNKHQIQGFRLSPEAVLNWLHGTWFDLLILAIILGYGFCIWFFRKFAVKDGQLYVQDGFIFRRKRIMPIKNLSALTIEHALFLRPFKASYLYADTASGLLNATDIKLLIRKKDEQMFVSALPRLRQGKRHHYERKVRIWKILLFSVIFSSSFSGALYIAIFWFQSGRIARDLINEFKLTEKLNSVSQEVANHLEGIPPIAVTMGILILFSWLFSMISNLIRYGGFRMESDKRQLFVKSGLMTTRYFYLQNHKINFLDIRQNLITKWFKIYSLAVNCPGYGNQRGSMPICLPILTYQELVETMPMIFPGSRFLKNQLYPPKRSWWGYICWCITGFVAIYPTGEFIEKLFPSFQQITNLVQIMLVIPIVWKLIIQIVSLNTSGVSVSKNRICMRYCRGFAFHTIVAETDSIVKVRVHQHIWQRKFNTCHLTIYFRAEVPYKCNLYCLDYTQTKELLSEFMTNLK